MRAGLFPGQGSQTPDMPLDTAGQQPAIFGMSVESWQAAQIECDVFAGHSLGSYAALVAAGSVDADAAAEIVRQRGLAMADAAREHPGAMIALLGATIERASEVADEFGLTVANDNAPGQVVLTGEIAGVEALEEAQPVTHDEAGNERRLRLKRLPVSGAFHSPLVKSAAARLSDALSKARFGDASHVIANGTAQPYVDPQHELASELLAPVRFRESLLYMWKMGVREFVEFEPAGVLIGLVKRTLPEARALKVSDLISTSGGA
ncbi:MAG: ACP S-malonyltransferase [Actinobacteria bacterium]|nr:ACP S-malonyltransferase [Actinomycetota bacterium]